MHYVIQVYLALNKSILYVFFPNATTGITLHCIFSVFPETSTFSPPSCHGSLAQMHCFDASISSLGVLLHLFVDLEHVEPDLPAIYGVFSILKSISAVFSTLMTLFVVLPDLVVTILQTTKRNKDFSIVNQ